jgi:hypothetical protein
MHIVEQHSEMEQCWERIEELVEEFRLRKQERSRKEEQERRKS